MVIKVAQAGRKQAAGASVRKTGDGAIRGSVAAGAVVSGSRFGTVDFLRCVAGTAVLWHHISHSSKTPSIAASGSLGWIGVEIFFVVSGFIIPFAMQRAAYQFPSDAKRFVARRLVRLDPPYFLASAIAALLSYAAWKTPGFRGPEPPISWASTVAHVGYLNGICELPWYNPVCWTLGIEFQFYLFAAMLFPIFAGRANCFLPFAFLTAAAAILFANWEGHVAHSPWLLRWWPIFLMGVSAYRLRIGAATKGEFWFAQSLAAGVAMAIGRWEGAMAGVLSSLLIGFTDIRLPRLWAWYASITYSLYLVHIPVGTRVVHLIQRAGNTVAIDAAAVALGMVTSLLVALLFWRYVELPSMRWAAMLQPNRPQK